MNGFINANEKLTLTLYLTSYAHHSCVVSHLSATSCLFVRAGSAEFGYLGDKVLVTRVVCGDDGEDVPVVFLHDVEHDGGLLLDGGSELKEH